LNARGESDFDHVGFGITLMNGALFIGARAIVTANRFRGYNPETGTEIEPEFSVADASHVAKACALAEQAFDRFRDTTPTVRAHFLETIADRILALGDALLERVVEETALPRERLAIERDRTLGQLRKFAEQLRQGRWAGIVIEPALEERSPFPRPDLRQRRIAVGPVAVFGSSNFPLAFSVAGGDTASAFAAGCPVVVKGHPAHPGTSAMIAGAVREAVTSCGMPEGTFTLLQGPSNRLGAALVTDPRIKAVGFTGSRGGGLALLSELAAHRSEPIPVFAEMSSVNPVLLFPAALSSRAEEIAAGYVASLTVGAGQLCTNPGIVIAVPGPGLDRFLGGVVEALSSAPPQVMLSPGIYAAYRSGVEALGRHGSVETLVGATGDFGASRGGPAIFVTDAKAFLDHPELGTEIFGAASLVVRAQGTSDLRRVIEAMEGQLTVTLHLDDEDIPLALPLIPLLERKAGRILANGWPTGVEVSAAMVHGGPFPATSDPRSTSVGAAAIERFLRPVCYQNLPDALLPLPVKRANPLSLPRLIDGDPIAT
jgi:NADP-dependent aldehyde dehydrogenase